MKAANYWKLGLFVALGVGLALAAVVYFGAGITGRRTVEYQVYFDESVQGLEVGSLVRFRGVTLGQVSRMAVAPDHRHVQVRCPLAVGELHRQGIAVGEGDATRLLDLPDLRAQLALVGLTGQMIVLLDFVDPAKHPVEALTFPTPSRTIPAATSTLKTIEDSLERATAQLPELVDTTRRLIVAALGLVDQLRGSGLVAHANGTIARANGLLTSMQGTVDRLSSARVPEQTGQALAELDTALAALSGMVADLSSDHGLVASAQRAADALGDVGRGSNGLGRDVGQTLREADSTLRTIRQLAEDLERNPDMLLKGRARGSP